ncbi:MAG: site-2 protease family protein [Ruminococcus sp.]|uniref:site-2 protease family protein n=1 Tax=Ruminococcus sp. TaxID=41978 RepID=UPI0025F8C107|nr:site-2 protease family protein [Ruminococcus sp.]MCR5600693.1 site-2 protease family protein [Ruminococcus sp.]
MEKLFRFLLVLISRGVLVTALMPAACYVKAWVAKALGDDTPERQGRLSLDFRKHTDFYGILITMILGFGWSREMNNDVSKLKNMKRDITLISLAAPAAYFIMYVLLYNLSGFIFGLAPTSFLLACIYRILRKAGFSCLCFGVIALLPIPPLDGFQIFYQFSWPKFRRWYFSRYQKIMLWSRYILLGIFFLDDITDGEYSLLRPLIFMWSWIWDHLVFFNVNWLEVTEKIIKTVFGYRLI